MHGIEIYTYKTSIHTNKYIMMMMMMAVVVEVDGPVPHKQVSIAVYDV